MGEERKNLLDIVVYFTSWVGSFLGTVIVVAMAGLTTLDVVLRLFFKAPIVGASEISEYMMVALSLAIGWCAIRGRVIRVNIIVEHLSARAQKRLESVMLFLSLLLCACIVWGTIKDGIGWLKMGYISSVLQLPKYPFYFVLASGFGILCLSVFYLITKQLRRKNP